MPLIRWSANSPDTQKYADSSDKYTENNSLKDILGFFKALLGQNPAAPDKDQTDD